MGAIVSKQAEPSSFASKSKGIFQFLGLTRNGPGLLRAPKQSWRDKIAEAFRNSKIIRCLGLLNDSKISRANKCPSNVQSSPSSESLSKPLVRNESPRKDRESFGPVMHTIPGELRSLIEQSKIGKASLNYGSTQIEPSNKLQAFEQDVTSKKAIDKPRALNTTGPTSLQKGFAGKGLPTLSLMQSSAEQVRGTAQKSKEEKLNETSQKSLCTKDIEAPPQVLNVVGFRAVKVAIEPPAQQEETLGKDGLSKASQVETTQATLTPRRETPSPPPPSTPMPMPMPIPKWKSKPRAYPRSFSEASPEDRMLLKLKDQGFAWREIAGSWEAMTGCKTNTATLSRRYRRLKAELTIFESRYVSSFIAPSSFVSSPGMSEQNV
ncbi:hypothetical protein KEM56_001553 [Ascosphaera pollenicola]|nr:hypothetical protein KEM56_001553 [Ascosphaera pollenicola]